LCGSLRIPLVCPDFPSLTRVGLCLWFSQALLVSFCASPMVGGARWADLVDSSQEPAEDARCELVADDSYRERPSQELDNSRGGLNLCFARAAALGAEGSDVAQATRNPRDFSFLSEARSKAPSSPTLEEAPENSLDNTGCAHGSAPTLQLSAEDLEKSHTDFAFLTSARVTSARNPLSADAPTFVPTLLEPCFLGQPSSASSQPRGKQRRRDTANTSSPPEKRSKPEDAPAAEGEASLVRTLPPEASEEDWQHRLEKRQKSVATIKSAREYQFFTERRDEGARRASEPRTPDFKDRAVSKRRWEHEVQQWRLALKQWCAIHSLGDAASRAA